jgi:hypothetical protein
LYFSWAQLDSNQVDVTVGGGHGNDDDLEDIDEGELEGVDFDNDDEDDEGWRQSLDSYKDEKPSASKGSGAGLSKKVCSIFEHTYVRQPCDKM